MSQGSYSCVCASFTLSKKFKIKLPQSKKHLSSNPVVSIPVLLKSCSCRIALEPNTRAGDFTDYFLLTEGVVIREMKRSSVCYRCSELHTVCSTTKLFSSLLILLLTVCLPLQSVYLFFTRLLSSSPLSVPSFLSFFLPSLILKRNPCLRTVCE